MNTQLYIKNHVLDDFSENILDFNNFKSNLLSYKGTNLKQANIFLNKNLNNEEKEILFNLLFSQQGWYRKINGDSSIQLKFSSYSLGFTHNQFNAINPLPQFQHVMQNISNDTFFKINNCYLKQKILSKKTLINYIEFVNTNNMLKFYDNKIWLYRGVKTNNCAGYITNSLESWTSQLNIAQQFAGKSGIILKTQIDIDDIFCCRKTAFKHDNLPSLNLQEKINQGQLIRREHEFIVEFMKKSFTLKYDKSNIYILN